MKYKLYKPFALLLSYIMLIMMMANLTFAEENNDSVNTFNVPVVMKNINGSGAVSMGNGAML